MSNSEALDERDAAVVQQSLHAQQQAIELLDELILHLNHGTALLAGKPHDRGLNFLTGLLVGRAFNSLWRAREDAVRGYPAQSLTLCRAAMEDWGVSRWVEQDPTRADLWLWAFLENVERPKTTTKKGDVQDARPPRFAEIWKGIGSAALSEERLKEIYGALSLFGHPRGQSLGWQFHSDAESSFLHYGSHFDEQDLRGCLYFLLQITQMLFNPIANLQKRGLGEVDSAWLDRASELSNRAEASVFKLGKEIKDDGRDSNDAS